MYKYIGNIHLKLVYNVTKIGAIVYAIDLKYTGLYIKTGHAYKASSMQ